MDFTTRKRRSAPNVIIISLIDVLIVVLIFLMVTTTFKQQPALKLALPRSHQQQKKGANENSLIVTITKEGPLYLKADPVTLDTLQQKLTEAKKKNPETTVAIRADTAAPIGQVVKVMDAAQAAGITVPASFFINSIKAPTQ